MPALPQVSAGGIVFRTFRGKPQVCLISVGDPVRWFLPKGLVRRSETPEAAAQREVQEETGLATDLLGPLDTIEYWYYGAKRGGGKVRFHKQVHFFLFRYRSGRVADHDHEVNEARWFYPEAAREHLAFANEKKLIDLALPRIEQHLGRTSAMGQGAKTAT